MLRVYEAMLLVDYNIAQTNFPSIQKEIEKILRQYKANIISLKKWGDKKLAYTIKRRGEKHTRGTYVLVYFEAEPSAVKGIKEEFRLSDNIIRYLILVSSHEKATKEVPFIKEEVVEEEQLMEEY